jgi:hypothetical protein
VDGWLFSPHARGLRVKEMQCRGSWTVHVRCNSTAVHSENMFKTKAKTFLVIVTMNVAIFQLLTL